jgi:hypothetical protein
MYGALCAVLGPALGADKVLQTSAAWKLIALRAWAVLPEDGRGRMEYALHELSDGLSSLGAAATFRAWAANPDIKALGEWR